MPSGESPLANGQKPMFRACSAWRRRDEIAACALALASYEFPYMTGASFVVDGGKTAASVEE
jgi:hypothetical protein